MNRNFVSDIFVGNFILGIASTALTELVLGYLGDTLQAQWGIEKSFFRLMVFTLILLALFLPYYLKKFSQWVVNLYKPNDIKPEVLRATYPGLIVLASRSVPGVKSAPQVAIEHHWQNGVGNLQHCWLICGGQESLDSARQALGQMGFTCFDSTKLNYEIKDRENHKRILKVSLRTIQSTDINNPHKTFKLVNQIFEEAAREGIAESDIIADYTGGTKSMTAGLILACTSPNRKLQFMNPGAYLADGRADASVDSIATEIQVNFKLKPIKS